MPLNDRIIGVAKLALRVMRLADKASFVISPKYRRRVLAGWADVGKPNRAVPGFYRASPVQPGLLLCRGFE
jgi:hypothetical protein